MQAVVQSMDGGPEVLEFAEVEKPMPDGDEALVRVVAATDMVHLDRLSSKNLPAATGLRGLDRLR
jgi:NADPH:quinone reductase-like Zn-dependent oxidoreductase